MFDTPVFGALIYHLMQPFAALNWPYFFSLLTFELPPRKTPPQSTNKTRWNCGTTEKRVRTRTGRNQRNRSMTGSVEKELNQLVNLAHIRAAVSTSAHAWIIELVPSHDWLIYVIIAFAARHLHRCDPFLLSSFKIFGEKKFYLISELARPKS